MRTFNDATLQGVKLETLAEHFEEAEIGGTHNEGLVEGEHDNQLDRQKLCNRSLSLQLLSH